MNYTTENAENTEKITSDKFTRKIIGCAYPYCSNFNLYETLKYLYGFVDKFEYKPFNL